MITNELIKKIPFAVLDDFANDLMSDEFIDLTGIDGSLISNREVETLSNYLDKRLNFDVFTDDTLNEYIEYNKNRREFIKDTISDFGLGNLEFCLEKVLTFEQESDRKPISYYFK